MDSTLESGVVGCRRRRPQLPGSRGARRRLESASVQTSARGSDARNERGGEGRSRRHGRDDSAPGRGIRKSAASPQPASVGEQRDARSVAGQARDSRARARETACRVRRRAVALGASSGCARSEPPAARIGRVRSGREARHVAREPQRQRPRPHPVRDLVRGEPRRRRPRRSRRCARRPRAASASSSASGIGSPIALAVPCQPALAACDDELGRGRRRRSPVR